MPTHYDSMNNSLEIRAKQHIVGSIRKGFDVGKRGEFLMDDPVLSKEGISMTVVEKNVDHAKAQTEEFVSEGSPAEKHIVMVLTWASVLCVRTRTQNPKSKKRPGTSTMITTGSGMTVAASPL